MHIERERSLGNISRLLKKIRPDLVGITSTACQAVYIPVIAAMAKRWNASVPVICGGAHPTVAPESVIALEDVDGLLRGEGEIPMLEFCRKLREGVYDKRVPGFWMKNNGRIVKNKRAPRIEDLNTLPPIDREALDFQRFIDLCNGCVVTLHSRGCNWKCAFCSNVSLRKANTGGQYVRNQSVERALDEIELMASKYRFNYLSFRDDTFTWNKAWSLKFAEEYPRRFRFPFDFFSRMDCLDHEIIDAYSRAGCKNIFIGLDSGD